jgi:peroxiredoxin Q/BCP
MVEDDDKAADFELPTDGGKRLKLSRLTGKPVVLYFYAEDDTSGCTVQAKDFSRLAADLSKVGAEVIGVSPDGVESHHKLRRKYDLAINLAADADTGGGADLRRVGREVDVRAHVHAHVHGHVHGR